MKILQSIRDKFLKRNEEKTERKVKNILSKINFYNKIMCFIPILDVINLWMINKKIKISYNYSENYMKPLIVYRGLSSLFLVILGSVFMFAKHFEDRIIFGYIALFLCVLLHFSLSILQSSIFSKKTIKEVVLVEDEQKVLDKEDFEILKANIDYKVLSDFMVKNDFKIRYCDMSGLGYEIEKDKQYTIQKDKAMEILLSKSSVKEKVEI